jgi:hypothetical protein
VPAGRVGSVAQGLEELIGDVEDRCGQLSVSDTSGYEAVDEKNVGSIEPRFEEHGGEELEVYEVLDGTTSTFVRPVAGVLQSPAR